MPRLKIGVVVESFRLGLRRGMRAAAELGLRGVQVDATQGALAPENLTQSGRRDFLAQARSYNLEVSALGGNFGQGGLSNPNRLDEVVGRIKRIVELAADLRVPVVATYIGKVPQGEDDLGRDAMVEALNEVGRHAENYGRFLATETGAEDAAVLLEFLDSLDTDGIKVNYDPGNLAMAGFDPVAGVFALKDHIVHTHAKDGVRHPDGSRQEAALGEGDVDWLAYIAALEAVGYKGFYTIEGDMGPNPKDAVARAKEFLAKL